MSGNADAFTIYLLGLGKFLNLLVCFFILTLFLDVIFELCFYFSLQSSWRFRQSETDVYSKYQNIFVFMGKGFRKIAINSCETNVQ